MGVYRGSQPYRAPYRHLYTTVVPMGSIGDPNPTGVPRGSTGDPNPMGVPIGICTLRGSLWGSIGDPNPMGVPMGIYRLWYTTGVPMGVYGGSQPYGGPYRDP